MKQLQLLPRTNRVAVFNKKRTHRYSLFIHWGDGPLIHFCLLNPSQADEHVNDPTVERCQRRAKRLGYGAVVITNIFAFRSTNPAALKTCDDPVGGDENDNWIRAWAQLAEMTVCAWGVYGAEFDRSNRVRKLLVETGVQPFCLGTCANGDPRHPLYVSYNVHPTPYEIEIV